MSLIIWSDDFFFFFSEVDEEHQELIQFINDAHNALSRQNDSEIAVIEFLGEIYVRASAHFLTEERIMRERHYDQYEDHKADHERLLDEIRDIMDNFEDKTAYNEQEFSQKLHDWFANHFKTKDARFHQYL